MIKLFLKTLPKWLTILVVISFFFLIFKITYLNQLPAVWAQAYELGVILEAFITSFIASYIFYLAVVHYKEVKESYNFYPYAIRWSKGVVNTCKVEISHFSTSSGIEFEFETLTEEQLAKAFSSINPHQNNAPIMFPSASGYICGDWIDYLKSNLDSNLNKISKITESKIQITPEWMRLLTEIENCNFVIFVQGIQKTNIPGYIPGSPFQTNGDLYYDFYEKCLTLNQFIEKLESKYFVSKM